MLNYSHLYEEIKSHCSSEERETGGLVVKRNGLVVVPCRNGSANKSKFIPFAKDYIAASRMGKIVAIFHSHITDEDFSPQDKLTADAHNLDIILYNVPSGQVRIYRPQMEKYNCVDFVQDYFKGIGVKIVIDSSDPSKIGSMAQRNNLVKVKEYKKDAILVIKTESGYHLGICLDENYYFHYNKTGEFKSLIPKKFVHSIYVVREYQDPN